MNLTEKAAYIQGLLEGLDMDSTKKETKVLKAMLELITEMANDVSDLNEDVGQLYDEIDAIDEDLDEVEEFVFGDEDEDDDDFDEDDEYEAGLYEIRCPNCSEVVCVDEDMLSDDNLACPNCNTKFEIDFSDDCDCDGSCCTCPKDK